MRLINIGCGIIIVILLSYGCSMTDHSRNFLQEVSCDGNVELTTEVLLEKSGSEQSNAEQKTDSALDVPLGVLM